MLPVQAVERAGHSPHRRHAVTGQLTSLADHGVTVSAVKLVDHYEVRGPRYLAVLPACDCTRKVCHCRSRTREHRRYYCHSWGHAERAEALAAAVLKSYRRTSRRTRPGGGHHG